MPYYYGIDSTYIILVLPTLLIALWAQFNVKSTFNRYSKQPNSRGLTGEQVARRILDENGLHDVRVEGVSGRLSDHYDPKARVVRLSQSVFGSSSVAAVGVAAHEVGHAIQHSVGYGPLALRNMMIPLTSIMSTLSFPLLLVGILLSLTPLVYVSIAFFGVAVVVQMVTLPVELNASSRAMAILEQTGRRAARRQKNAARRGADLCRGDGRFAGSAAAPAHSVRRSARLSGQKRVQGARELALLVLHRVCYRGAYLHLALKEAFEQTPLSPSDRALCNSLCHGVLQQMQRLDYTLAQFMKLKQSKIAPHILLILRMAAFSLSDMQSMPDYAIVDESVALARRYGHKASAGFVNGVLRSMAKQRGDLPLPKEADLVNFYSLPVWMVKSFVADYGKPRAVALCRALTKRPPAALLVNRLKTDKEALKQALLALDIQAVDAQIGKDALLCADIGPLFASPLYEEGHCSVMGLPSQLAANLLGCTPGAFVVDCCAAPGGKTLCMALDMQNSGSLHALDLHPQRAALISQNAARFGLSIVKAAAHDARAPKDELVGLADFVLCDAPCSGLGQLAKKPDIRLRDEAEFADLPALQLQILSASADYVKPGGALLYSTCTLRKSENEGVVAAFLAQNGDFFIEDLSTLLPEALKKGYNGEDLSVFPGEFDTDGFYIAKLRRRADATGKTGA